MTEPFLEVCVETIESAIIAERGGAHRIELCSALSEGGLTPSYGFLRKVCQELTIPVFPMIRPRGGDFFYSNDEFDIMKEDIQQAKAMGVQGVVFGLLRQDSTVDIERTSELVHLARPLKVTFHRAFDLTEDLSEALEDVIATGADTLLTSGGHAKITGGIKVADKLFQQAKGRIQILIGSGISTRNVRSLAEATSIRNFHASLRVLQDSPVAIPKRMVGSSDEPTSDYLRPVLKEESVREVLQILRETKALTGKAAKKRDLTYTAG